MRRRPAALALAAVAVAAAAVTAAVLRERHSTSGAQLERGTVSLVGDSLNVGVEPYYEVIVELKEPATT